MFETPSLLKGSPHTVARVGLTVKVFYEWTAETMMVEA